MTSDARRHTITVARGDGIGPEVTDATLRILEAADAPLDLEPVTIGLSAYEQGHPTGITPEAWETIRRNEVFLKGPITTPQGGGYRSVNVTIRTSLGLYANVRPTSAFAPFVHSMHPGMDLVVVRENEEDLYAGIEYPDIRSEHHIVDIGAARLAAQPERFDVIVTLNLYGDVLSDIAGQVAGSVGISGSANIGARYAMFEAVHGSAPDIAGRGVANPSGILNAAVQMLVHLGEAPVAERIANAWLATLESGLHTADLHREGLSEREVTTDEFTDAVIARLGSEPERLRPASFETRRISVPEPTPVTVVRERAGIDVYVHWDEPGRDPGALAHRVERATEGSPLHLALITNRGVEVHPGGHPETFVTDHWRCRFLPERAGASPTLDDVLAVPPLLAAAGIEVVGTEVLQRVDGAEGYSSGASG